MKIQWYYTLPILILFSPFALAMGYTFPLADDFARANEARIWFDVGQALESMGRSWWTWSGRYTHHFLVIFFGKSAESRFGYMAICALLSSLYWISLWGIFSELLKKTDRAKAFFISSICMLGLYSCHPSLPISFYEVTDLLGITAGNGFVLLFIWSLCALWNSKTISRKHRWATLGSAIAAIGCYEHSAIATPLIALLACAIALYSDHHHKRFFVTVLIVSCVFFFIAFFARGNFRRQTKRNVSFEQVTNQLILAFDAWISFAFTFFSSAFLTLCIWIGTCVGRDDAPPLQQSSPKISAIKYIVLCTFSVLFLTSGIIIVHALSDVPIQNESKLTSSILLLTAYLVGACSITVGQPIRRLLKRTRLQNGYIIVTGILLALFFTQQYNFQQTLYSQFSGEAAAYAASKEKRNAFLYWQSFVPDNRHIIVSRELLSPHPNAVGYAIPDHPQKWPADNAAAMFGVRAVSALLPSAITALSHQSTQNLWTNNAAIPVTDSSSIRLVVHKNITAGPNDTFRFHWIFIDSLQEPLKSLKTVVFLNRQSNMLTPRWIQNYFTRDLLTQDCVPQEQMPSLVGIHQQWDVNEWAIVPHDEAKISCSHAIPVAAPEWGEIKAVFASVNNSDFVRLSVHQE
jgi:hypothetical protein